MRTKIVCATVILILLSSGMSAADVPRTLNYQGVLTDPAGAPITGDHLLTFRLYTTADGGSEVWSEADSAEVTNGVFNCVLGLTTPLDLSFDQTYWLSIAVDDGPEMTPRSRLTSSPYALRAALADSIIGGGGDSDWIVTGDDMYAGVSGRVGIGTTVPLARLDVNAAGADLSSYALIRTSGSIGYGGGLLLTNLGSSAGTSFKLTSSYNFNGNGIARFGFVDNVDTETFIGGPALEFNYNGNIGINGKVGIGATPNEKLTVEGVLSLDETTTPSVSSGYGKLYVKSSDSKLYFRSDSGTEYNLTSTGGSGTVTSISQGTGITCSPNPITATGTVAFNQTWGDSRYVNEGQGNSITPSMLNSAGGAAGQAPIVSGSSVVWGYPTAQALIVPYAATVNSSSILLDLLSTSSYSDSPAILGTRASHDNYGIGVKGVGGWRGVVGTVTGTGDGNYRGVDCHASGSTGSNVYGLYAEAAGSGTNFKAAVYGTASSGHAGYFNGYLYATSASATIKAFTIDHPLDPANKYLRHSSVESPDMMNVYNGNVVVDASGGAWVELPEWFEALNGDYRYQLTPMGAPGPNLYVAEEISGNRFRIAGGEPGMKVSWMVTGIRHDPAAARYRVRVEEDKPAQERDKYLVPEAYGLPETMRIGYSPSKEENR